MARARLIAYYLPQFHPIPENDSWWGKGFTEWTNVAKAKPLFAGHYQPRLPSELGFYDLRVPETRAAQASLAHEHGIEGFCYWHYWFAGRRLLERPFDEVLRTGEPDFPFCLAWANASWTGIWHGAPNRLLMEQTYPGRADYEAHFFTVLEALADPRHITLDGKPVFVVYLPYELPDPVEFTDCWRELALKVGFPGLYLIGHAPHSSWNPYVNGFDAAVLKNPRTLFSTLARRERSVWYNKVMRKTIGSDVTALHRTVRRQPVTYQYAEVIDLALPGLSTEFEQFPCVIPNWDNTPRSGLSGVVLHESSPALFKSHLVRAIAQVMDKREDGRFVFIKSWNEWAEGNYLEPDMRFGNRYLEAVKGALEERWVEKKMVDSTNESPARPK